MTERRNRQTRWWRPKIRISTLLLLTTIVAISTAWVLERRRLIDSNVSLSAQNDELARRHATLLQQRSAVMPIEHLNWGTIRQAPLASPDMKSLKEDWSVDEIGTIYNHNGIPVGLWGVD